MYDFKFKPFEDMTPEDYAEVGFKSGLEIHQQLLTEKKLFCRCPAGHFTKEYHAEILRHMRPTLSELGEYDGTALMEFKTKKEIVYRINRNNVCTYEMDDTPPFEMNEQALDIAIEVGMLLNSKVVDEIHIARKQYLDGSIPTGFQRTAIISVGGAIPFKDRQINIIQMSLEEDSCREVSDKGHYRIYNADRLGMPLIETVTHPDMRTPQEVAEVNDILRRLSRSTTHVRTGIGASRQDVNVSVRGGTRIEIKGVHKIKSIPLLTYNEAMRQWNLLRLREELKKRKITEDTFEAKTDDVTKLLRRTLYKPVHDALAEGKVAKCVTLRGFKGLLSWRTQTDTFFAKEISDRVRVIACLDVIPNIIHSDSQENTLSTSEGQKIRKYVGATEDDTLVIVWGDERDTTTAAKEIEIRAKEATIGIPSETRQALRDGTTGFERILPGPERMYPDTDLPPKLVTDDRVGKLREGLPVLFWENEKWYRELGLPEDVIRPLAFSSISKLFKKCVEDWKMEPMFVGCTLIRQATHLKRKYDEYDSLTDEVLETIMQAHRDGKVARSGVWLAMESVVQEAAFRTEMLLTPATDEEIKKAIEDAKVDMKDIKLFDEKNHEVMLIRTAMRKLFGRVDGEKVVTLIKNQEG